MTKRLTCPGRHAWDWRGEDTVPICPVCGAPAVLVPPPRPQFVG